MVLVDYRWPDNNALRIMLKVRIIFKIGDHFKYLSSRLIQFVYLHHDQ